MKKASLGPPVNVSAFIPFCEFGGNMFLLGKESDNFSWPVCNKFQPTVHSGQLCYSLDLNAVEGTLIMKKGRSNGLVFAMDYNDDKMVRKNHERFTTRTKRGLHEMHHSTGSDTEALIFLDTLG